MKKIQFAFLFSTLWFGCGTARAEVNPETLTCEDLGFIISADKCGDASMIKCPFDLNKVICEEAFVGEIKIYSGKEENIPIGWLKADGRSLSSATYRDLYTAIGTTFGGYGGSFYLPNLSGRIALGTDSSCSGYACARGSAGGSATHTLTVSEMPSHNHGYTGQNGTGYPDGSADWATPGVWDSYPRQTQLNNQGGSQPHNNLPPYVVLFYIIYTGVYL